MRVRYLIACLPLVFGAMFTSNSLAAIQLAYLGDLQSSAYAGIQQGLLEANLQVQFLGREPYSVKHYTLEQWWKADHSPFIAVLAAVQKDELIRLTDRHTDLPIFNLTALDTALRTACYTNLLHTIPSRKMLDDAVAQWRKKKPYNQAHAQAWHSDFKKFAARDLNKRFLLNQKMPMDDYAWAGWAAVKVVTEVVSRHPVTRPADILHYLKTSISFDGQKGDNMSFRQTGQLRQLVLLVEADNIVAEAPVRGIAGTRKLDSLGVIDCQ